MASSFFNVTLVNLAPGARSAVADQGRVPLGKISTEELIVLLEAFRELDPVQSLEADPEIVVEVRREKYLIRTDRKNLLLYNARNSSEPAYKLGPAEIIAELDGSAASARTMAPFIGSTEKPADTSEYVPPPAAPRKPPVLLALAAGLLGAAVLSLAFLPLLNRKPALYTEITDPSELATVRAEVVGVYMTGSAPGHHGIAVMEDGTIKIFQLNHQVAPSVIHDTSRVGRLDGRPCLITNQPGGAIEVRNRDTLVYGGETYLRIP